LLVLLIGIFFQIIFSLFSSNVGGFLGEVLNFLSFFFHFDFILRGVIDSRDIIYFLSIIFLGLIFIEVNLAKKRN